MVEFIHCLKVFNRKERFLLVGMALGNPEFRLSPEFRQLLGHALHLEVPSHAFAAMDYHLDWLYASVFLASHGKSMASVYPNADHIVKGTQEDLDLLVAFQLQDVGHVVMLEAKGVTGFTNRQLQSKARRLRTIFGDAGDRWPRVIPHFAIISPREPRDVETQDWPHWMTRDGRPLWLPMPLPAGLERMTRCNEEGRPSQHGSYWRVVPG